MIKIQKINDQTVKPIKIPHIDKSKIKGSELFDELYANIFLLAKKKSGKTSTIFSILKKCCGPNTSVIVFCSTVYKDDNWIKIITWLKKHKIDVQIFTSIYDDDGNQVQIMLDDLNALGEEKFKEIDDEKPQITPLGHLLFESNNDENIDGKENSTGILAPEYILVFDDMSDELKDPFIPVLLKKNRHYKLKVIISSQYYNDIRKDGRQQLDYMLIFGGVPEEKLIEVHKDLDLSIPLQTFLKCYKNATNVKYNFLYIDVRSEQLRRNFSHRYILSSN